MDQTTELERLKLENGQLRTQLAAEHRLRTAERYRTVPGIDTSEAARQYQVALEHERSMRESTSDADDIEHAEWEAALAFDRLVAAIAAREAAAWPDEV